MSSVLTAPAVIETATTTDHNWTEADIRQYFSLDDKAKALGKERNEVKRLRDSFLESFILLGQGEYRRMSPEGVIALLGIDRSIDMVKLYQLAGNVMATLVKGEKDDARKVWTAVDKAHKTKGVREGEASKVLRAMPEGSTWGDFAKAIDALCAAMTNKVDAPMTKLEATANSDWDRGELARFERLAVRLGYTITK
jgi:hypothetical protein